MVGIIRCALFKEEYCVLIVVTTFNLFTYIICYKPSINADLIRFVNKTEE